MKAGKFTRSHTTLFRPEFFSANQRRSTLGTLNQHLCDLCYSKFGVVLISILEVILLYINFGSCNLRCAKQHSAVTNVVTVKAAAL